MNEQKAQTKPAVGLDAVDRDVIRFGTSQLEEMLLALAKYGEPRLVHDGRGWYCCVEMYVTASGVNFKVASEFGRPTPMSAAIQCASRLDRALSDIGA